MLYSATWCVAVSEIQEGLALTPFLQICYSTFWVGEITHTHTCTHVHTHTNEYQ